MMTTENKKIVEGFFRTVQNRELDKLTDYMSTEVIDHNKMIFGEEEKPGAAFDGIRQQLAAFHPYHIKVEELIEEGNRVVARITQSGTHSGTHARMPDPTHRNFEVEIIFIFTIQKGKITEIRAVSDRLGLFFQLGWDWPKEN
ncbi:ester cyclase [Shimazuella sp. AN120528]|uniref:ester cyclase n=1 Tax=Shimazuella soli TaxID=1892854 RepID=UPI001F0EA5DA|nr:ester cyclase [Shimazuella soli]MCH5584413.1 ester cyclase [Shimazuella soli]